MKDKKTIKKEKAELTRLTKEADHLYQIKIKILKPKSAVSGEPTEVIHHWVNKARSNNLRYDAANGVPLTNAEHACHHLSGDSKIAAAILKHYGFGWDDDLQLRRRITLKLNKEYLQNIIITLKDTNE
jgi:hypothetical protein